ncbi:MAG: cation:proton antiporter [Candidatus Eisenbacteria bacterium]|nr:cation:proton antiporter [Candidatus Eisenbacteria bacterium]
MSASRALAAPGGAGGGAVPEILLGLAVILIAAKLGGELFARMGQPTVLGELLAGIILGNLHLIGVDTFDFLREEATFAVLAEIGVVILLFEVGLETSVREMLSVGWVAGLVAVVGIVVPTALGIGVSSLFHGSETFYVHLFVGTVLCATSVGITARVLKDLGALRRRESKIILGAAVIDDILGLLVLATVTAMIAAANSGATMSLPGLAAIIGKALAFLVLSILAGLWVAPRLFRAATRLRSRGLLMTLSLAFCFVLAFLAHRVGLASIVGAFTAGLILEDVHYRDLATREESDLHQLLQPIAALLLPVFFVLMGIGVDVRVFGDVSGLGFALVLTVAAVAGKQACSLAASGRGIDRLLVGFGMIPRGEVGLIFAGVGATLMLQGHPVISPQVFSAAVIMVMITTLATPPLLKWRLQRGAKLRAENDPGAQKEPDEP